MASPTKLARDNTMEATAKEGIEYLEKNRPDLAEQVKAVAKETPENGAGDATKTTNNGESPNNGDSPAKLPRDNTMVTTAEEGLAFLQHQGADDIIKQHGLDKLSPRIQKLPEKPSLVRDNTMVVTAKEGKEYLEKHGGVNADAKTRSQDAELNNSANQSPEKAASKRAAEDEPKADAEDAKKQKTDEEDGEAKEEKKDE